MLLAIPENIISAERFSQEELLLELAIALYAAGKISFGQARRLAGMDWFSFRQTLSERNVPANYDLDDFERDLESIKSFSLP